MLASNIEYGFIYSQKGAENLSIDTVDNKNVKRLVANNRVTNGDNTSFNLVIANIPDVVLNFRMTDSMFTQRRNGREFAKSQLELRKLIAKDLGYGIMAYIYAYTMYLLMISPSWILKIAYKVLR